MILGTTTTADLIQFFIIKTFYFLILNLFIFLIISIFEFFFIHECDLHHFLQVYTDVLVIWQLFYLLYIKKALNLSFTLTLANEYLISICSTIFFNLFLSVFFCIISIIP